MKFPLFVVLALYSMAGVASDDIQVLLPGYRLQAEQLAIIINQNDPLSVQIGEYYQKARGIPRKNVLRVQFRAGRPQMIEKEFRRIKEAIDNSVPASVQAFALTWAAPYRVGCMSITSAFAFGFDKSWCSKRRCAPTRRNPYFNRPGSAPHSEFGIRPTISIAATDFEQARALIDRGVRADNSEPAGTAYLVSTRDRARNVRAVYFGKTAQLMAGWIDTRVVEAEGLKNTRDILFYFTGKTRVPHLETLEFMPGAIADHLTSAGGQLTNSKQMSALRWLEAGATGSYGTVVEPCNLLGKFPHPGLLMDSYGAGRTLLESYWQSVEQPGEGIFIGEPLTAPFNGQRVEVQQDRVVLHTRSLSPGMYRLSTARNPVGPYQTVPGLLKAAYHQRTFLLPKLERKYYRLERVTAAVD
jgi:uncharacterized protein (TIGR03790 family)